MPRPSALLECQQMPTARSSIRMLSPNSTRVPSTQEAVVRVQREPQQDQRALDTSELDTQCDLHVLSQTSSRSDDMPTSRRRGISFDESTCQRNHSPVKVDCSTAEMHEHYKKMSKESCYGGT